MSDCLQPYQLTNMWYPISVNNTFINVLGYPLSYIEFCGTVTGLISVWLAAKNNIWTWPIGIVNVICFFLTFFEIHLYADMFLQVYFLVTSIYGWAIWCKRTDADSISRLTAKHRTMLAVLILVSTLIVGILIKNIHLLLPFIFTKPASYPFPDTFVAVLSVIGTILLAKKIIENWVLWVIADVFSFFLYAKKNVLFISVEYAVFVVLATIGLITWQKLKKNEARLDIG